MDEFIIKVLFDNNEEGRLKTWATNIFEAIDNILKLNGIEKILLITDTKTGKEWSFNKGNLKKLKELRKKINSESDVLNALRTQENLK
tara:strand:+ start:516 stop:779 length:264 start_codon:yes stop_codon:yes gene_type:complete